MADLRARKDLSEEGRRRQIAKARTDADAAMREIAKADQADREKRYASLIRQIFQNPKSYDSTAVVSYRDAQDRAAALKNAEEATALLSRARFTGDRLLAQAVAMRALDGAMRDTLGNTGWAADGGVSVHVDSGACSRTKADSTSMAAGWSRTESRAIRSRA